MEEIRPKYNIYAPVDKQNQAEDTMGDEDAELEDTPDAEEILKDMKRTGE